MNEEPKPEPTEEEKVCSELKKIAEEYDNSFSFSHNPIFKDAAYDPVDAAWAHYGSGEATQGPLHIVTHKSRGKPNPYSEELRASSSLYYQIEGRVFRPVKARERADRKQRWIIRAYISGLIIVALGVTIALELIGVFA